MRKGKNQGVTSEKKNKLGFDLYPQSFKLPLGVWLYVSRANTRSQQHDSFKGKGL
ncbi:hypothetical protein [Candidatus Regiella endosymbiont of Tuberolachnus salignus]|uniref:hypothetical protein n=1 Tax=Candidatus Regiella endosymbiont of Tuberolachnus salignus TaxID=3077956 RepID=UPI0030D2D9B1